MKKFTIAAIAMAFAGSAFAGDQDSADIHFAGEVQTNICTAELLGGGTSVQLIEVGNEIPAVIMAGNILNAVILEKT